MRSLISVILIVWCSGTLLAGFAPNTTPRSGFALVTLVSGNIAGLVGTETVRKRTSSGSEQAVIPPSPLITTASMLVPVGSVGENTTAIAIANPSTGSGGVNLILTDKIGTVVMNVVVHLGPSGHFSKYLNEFFATPVAFSTPLLLTVSSEIPISIVALNFRSEDFTLIPLVSLSAPTSVAVQPLMSTTTVPIEICSTLAVNSPTPPSAANGFGLGVAPPPTTATRCSTTAGVQTVTPPSSSTPQPGLFPGISPAPTSAFVGGTATLVFPQVVTGGAWSTDIVLGNTSAGTQTVRIDFFSSDGLVTSSLTDISIPPQGVFFFSSEMSGTTGN